eukprot:TRINITY_DN67042_c0_g1_i1.p1 TRINITY_DN67042_c0_g1~~TRINITY_DN67042_c0_g1_i1.p1  ORF type:complete len:235 (-),score=49.01 TRINITY_DN67042_c0_g1_i1:82-786(-)
MTPQAPPLGVDGQPEPGALPVGSVSETPRYLLPGVSTVTTECAKVAAAVAAGDWGPVFVYGMLTSTSAWANLIGRVPDMRPAMLKDYERRAVHGAGFAALFQESGSLTIGQAVFGLVPSERRLMDAVVDDGFLLTEVKISFLDDPESADAECTTYVWKEEFLDAVKEEDWDMEDFHENYSQGFIELCKDTRESTRANKLDDAGLKDLAYTRRRREAGADDEVPSSYQSEVGDDA